MEHQDTTLNNKKIINLIVTTCILFFLLLVAIIVDIILYINNIDCEFFIKLAEILLSSSASATLCLTFTFQIKLNIKANNNKGDDCNNINEQSLNSVNNPLLINGSNANVSVTYISPAIEQIMDYYQNILLPNEKENMREIAEKTFTEMQKESNGNEIDKDFVLRFIESSRSISAKDIQDIWVKLLVLKSKEPNGVSLRALDIIKNMTGDEAKTFETIARLSNYSGIISKMFDKKYFSWSTISLLQDIGLLKSGSFTVNTIHVPANSSSLYISNSKYVIVLENKDSKIRDYQTDCYVLTSEGEQLKKALSLEIFDEELFFLASEMKKKNTDKEIEIKTYKVISIDKSGVEYDTSKDFSED